MKQESTHYSEHSSIISGFSRFVEWGNKYFTLAQWIFKKADHQIFVKVESMMVVITAICLVLLIVIQHLHHWIGIVVCILLIQRVFEFFIIYSRNFIFNRGRIFSIFSNSQKRGEWLITMFALNIMQLLLIFAIWYQMISLIDPQAFSQPLHVINSIYFSFVTFITVGYGDIYPISSLARLVNIGQMALVFYTVVIVVNGLISIHFNRQSS